MLNRLLLGLLISAAIGGFAYWRKSLSASGVLGAMITGTLIFGFGGWIPGMLLVIFFVTSSALSKFKARSKAKREASAQFDKGGRRDIWQALANGGAATALAVAAGLSFASGAETLNLIVYAAMLGALGTVTADTWATELGVLNRGQPRLITTLRPAPPGTSGAISPAGTLAALAGALLIALVQSVLMPFDSVLSARGALASLLDAGQAPRLFLAALGGGFLGALSDSVLGATLQAGYVNAQSSQATERAVDANGAPNRLVRGLRWMTNDWVNFLSSLIGAALAAVIGAFL
jgi:uncharacterized protein (TIGR00297 family)